MALVYGLIDPRTRQLRYVGKTVKPLQERLTRHLCDKAINRRCQWIRSLRSQGLRPEIVPLLEVGNGEADDQEIALIAGLRAIGAELLNMADGGQGGSPGRKLSPQTIEKLRAINLGRKMSPEAVEKMARTKRGKKLSLAECERLSGVMRKRWKNPAYRQKTSEIHTERLMALRLDPKGWAQVLSLAAQGRAKPGCRAKQSASGKKAWGDPSKRQKILAGMSKKLADPAHREKLAAACRSRCKDPKWRDQLRARIREYHASVPSKHGFWGVYPRGTKWRAMLYERRLGTFNTKEEAARARDAEVIRLGLDLPLNFPDQRITLPAGA